MCNHLARIELDEHGRISFEVFHRHSEAKVVEDEELYLEVVEFGERETADLIAG